jgi:mRNA interferase RelE/StbE
MTVLFEQSFLKSVKKLKNKQVAKKVDQVIDTLKAAHYLKDIPNLKKLKGADNIYRIRVGDYRVLFERQGDQIVILLVVAHRKNIYKG